MSFFYIADLHIGHANVIKFDNRPYSDLNEMHNTIVDNWNRVVRGNDTVYILGDFCWAKESEWPFYLGPLAGQKVLIRGNHDPERFSQTTKKFLTDIKDYKEITDGGRHVILSHYPIPFHKADYDPNCWMLYGHVHNTREFDFMQKLRREVAAARTEQGHCIANWINVGCMMPWMDYTPRTLDEIIEREAAFGEQQKELGQLKEKLAIAEKLRLSGRSGISLNESHDRLEKK